MGKRRVRRRAVPQELLCCGATKATCAQRWMRWRPRYLPQRRGPAAPTSSPTRSHTSCSWLPGRVLHSYGPCFLINSSSKHRQLRCSPTTTTTTSSRVNNRVGARMAFSPRSAHNPDEPEPLDISSSHHPPPGLGPHQHVAHVHAPTSHVPHMHFPSAQLAAASGRAVLPKAAPTVQDRTGRHIAI